MPQVFPRGGEFTVFYSFMTPVSSRLGRVLLTQSFTHFNGLMMTPSRRRTLMSFEIEDLSSAQLSDPLLRFEIRK